jgi:hypothetical protein
MVVLDVALLAFNPQGGKELRFSELLSLSFADGS